MPQDKIYADVDIANLALGYLGEQQIVSFTEDTREAKLCSLHYSNIKRALLESKRWSVARREQRLTRLTKKPVTRYQYVYQLPADYLRVLDVNAVSEPVVEDSVTQPDLKSRPIRDFEIAGNELYTSAEYVSLTYTANVDESLLSDLFVQALAVKLAARIAPALGEARMAGELIGLSKEYENEAWLMDLRQSRSGENSDFDYRSTFENPQINERYI